MPEEPVEIDASLEEELVAYLDGELDADAGRRIEELLASDTRVRELLGRLDRTWELLGELDTAGVEDGFAQTTLEMVAVAAGEDGDRARREAPRRRRRHWALAGGGMAAATLAGFLTVALLRGNPEGPLLRDVPILEQLDDYRQIDDFQFLLLLQEEFGEEEGGHER